jgi:hypothetical protein
MCRSGRGLLAYCLLAMAASECGETIAPKGPTAPPLQSR